MELALLNVCFRSTVRMLTLLKEHPNYQTIGKARRTQPKKHPGPINRLIWAFNLENELIEMITPTRTEPRRPVNFRVETAATRE
jgi:hypothetical protein